MLRLKRFAYRDKYTIGHLYDGDAYLCDTLEPPSARLTRNASAEAVLRAKAAGKRAIPSGVYRVEMAVSAKFGRTMPYLVGVTGFTGVMIHPGNYPADTEGCILPGWNRRVGMVCGSRSAMRLVQGAIDEMISKTGEAKIRVG